MAYSAQVSKQAVVLLHAKLVLASPVDYATFLGDSDFVDLIPDEAERDELVKARRLKEWDFLGAATAPIEVRLRSDIVMFSGSTKS